MLKTLAVAAFATTFYAAQVELFDQTTDALSSVQSQQATALAQIERVRLGLPPIPKTN